MQNNRNKKVSFLGYKRRNEEIKKEEDMNIKEEKPYIKITLKKPELNEEIIKEKNIIHLNEDKIGKKHNLDLDNNLCKKMIQTHINKFQNKICKKCGHEKSIINFNFLKYNLDYFNPNNARLFRKLRNLIRKCINKNNEKSLTICGDCLLELLNNEIEFENFIARNEINYSTNNEISRSFTDNLAFVKDRQEDPFKNLYESPFLKYLNSKEKINYNKNILSPENKKKNKFSGSKSIFNKMNKIGNKLINYDLNWASKNNKIYNNTSKNINSNSGNTKNLNSPFLPFNNYNEPFKKKCLKIIVPKNINSSMNNIHNLDKQNICLKDNNNINQSLQEQYRILNDLDFPQISHLNQSKGFIRYNNDISNANNLQFLNKDNFNEKDININANIAPNICSQGKITNEERQKDSKDIKIYENFEEREIHKNYKIIENKDFDDIIKLASSIYNKLLNIKIESDLNIDLNQSNQENQKLNLNFFNSNYKNKSFFNDDTIFDLNQLNNNNSISNFNEKTIL